MDNRNSFSWKNARLACCYEFWEHRRHQLLKAGVLLGFFLLINTIICIWLGSAAIEMSDISDYHIEVPMNFLFYTNLVMIVLATEISTSLMFGSLSRPTERITFLMMPLSMKEKLFGQILFYIAGGFIFSVVCSLVTSFVCFGITCIATGTNLFQYMGLISCDFSPLVWITLVASVIFSISCFSLGAVYFKRYAFILTLLVGYALNIVISIASTIITFSLLRGNNTITQNGLDIIWIFLLVLGVLATILNFMVMSRRFYLSDIK